MSKTYTRYLDWCESYFSSIEAGEVLNVNLKREKSSDFFYTLNKVVQSYYVINAEKQRVNTILRKTLDLLSGYVIPINLLEEECSLLPTEIKGEFLITTKAISLVEGELQISLLLFKIGIILDDKKVLRFAYIVCSFSRVKENKIYHRYNVDDFQHGLIGRALLYQTIYLLTDIDFCKERANYLFSTFKSESVGVTWGGSETRNAIKAFENPQDNKWRKKYFLEYEVFLKTNE